MTEALNEIPPHVIVRIPDILLREFRYDYLMKLGLPVFRDYTAALDIVWDEYGRPDVRPRSKASYGRNFEIKLFRHTYKFIVAATPPAVRSMIAEREAIRIALEPIREFDTPFVVISADEDARIESILAGNPTEMVKAQLLDGRFIEYGFDHQGAHPTTYDLNYTPIPIVVENSDKHLVVVNYALRDMSILVRREGEGFVAENMDGIGLTFDDLTAAYEFLLQTGGDFSPYLQQEELGEQAGDAEFEEPEYEYTDY